MHLSAYCSWQFTLTTLLGSINLKYPPNMLALCWHSTPAYYAFYYASIFYAGLLAAVTGIIQKCLNKEIIKNLIRTWPLVLLHVGT